MAGEKVYIADKETLDKIYNILAVDPIYGFIEHMNILSPTQRIEYIGLNKNFTPVSRNTNGSISLNDWAGFEILEANKPYMVRSDGTPDYRLQDNDYSKKYSDGSASDVANTSYDGGAFSWLQKIYKNETVVGDDRIVQVLLSGQAESNGPTSGFYGLCILPGQDHHSQADHAQGHTDGPAPPQGERGRA